MENYLGFPKGVAGEKLIEAGAQQARRHEVDFVTDEIKSVRRTKERFRFTREKEDLSRERGC